MSALMRSHDWAATPLGPPESWPEGLKVPLRMMLTSRFEMWLGWGDDLAFFYNDAYIPTLGVKHPTALGRPLKAVWAEIFADVEDRVTSVMREGVASWDKALMLLLERSGFPEETYHTFSYSPLRGDSGAIEGLMCIVIEETEKVISERRLETLRVLATALLPVRSKDELIEAVGAALATNALDFPFSAVRLVERADLLGADEAIDWRAAVLDGQPRFISLGDILPDLPRGPWDKPPTQGLIVPIGKAGALILGLNPYRREPEAILSFAKLVAVHVAGALSSIDAHLRESADIERLRQLSEAMLNHVWTSRPDGYLDWFNSRVYEYCGIEPAALVGDGWAQIVHSEDLIVASERWAAALASGDPYEVEFRLRAADGEFRWHITRAVALRGADGAINRWIGTNTDIHEQKAAAEALADLNATLEQQVLQRTGELMAVEEALRQSQKMEAVGQLTGGIAHDFNNLLSVISGGLQLLEMRINEGRLDAIPRYVDAAQAAARRAAALTQRLLAFSRRQTLDPKPTNVNRLVGDMEELIRRTVGPGVELEVVGAGGLWITWVDNNQLENALLNLCINARDAMPDGGRLTIETANKWLDDRAARERELPPGQYISLCVTDTGTGMTPEVIARAFDPFFTTKPLGQGTGLGLSMIYGFVRQSGGQVRIYSEEEKGTTICVYLPRHIGSESEIDMNTSSSARGYQGHGETVLVVDDEPTIRMLIIDVLEDAGYGVIEADDGQAGLKVLQGDQRIDLLITDVGLPGGMNGRQMADAGRVVRPELKVLFITGYAENAVVGNGHLEPGMQIVTKPFNIESLADKVREMLDH